MAEKENSITVEGKSVKDFLKDQERDDIKKEYKEATRRESSRGKLKPYQTYDRTPGDVKSYSQEEIVRMEQDSIYEERIKTLTKQLEVELAMDRPNRSKVILYELISHELWTCKALTKSFNDLLKSHGIVIAQNSMASWFSSITALDKPIGDFIVKKIIGGISHYRLLPSMYMLSLDDTYQLTKKSGTFTARDAHIRVPELEQERAVLGSMTNPIVDKEEDKEEEETTRAEPKVKQEQMDDAFPFEQEEKSDSKPEEFVEAITTLPRELTLKVKVEIPPIKILFGWDK